MYYFPDFINRFCSKLHMSIEHKTIEIIAFIVQNNIIPENTHILLLLELFI